MNFIFESFSTHFSLMLGFTELSKYLEVFAVFGKLETKYVKPNKDR